jgi:hypothetical protein
MEVVEEDPEPRRKRQKTNVPTSDVSYNHITQSTITLYKGHLTLTSDPSEGAGPCEPNIIMRAIKGPGPL